MDAPQAESGRGKLGTLDATLLVMGGIIGVGIFFTPAEVAQHVPHTGGFLAMWVLGALVALCGAATFAELGGTFPRSGGWFEFLREIYGPFVAFLFAWVILGVVATGAIAVIASFAGWMIAGLVPAWAGVPWAPFALAVTIVLGMTALVGCGIKVGATVQNLCMILKLVAIAALVVGGIAFFTPGPEIAGAANSTATGAGAVPPGAPAPGGITLAGILAAFLPVFFAFGGWQHLCYVAGEVVDPRRTLPRAILFGVAGVGLTYLLVNVAYERVLGIEDLATTEGFAAEVARRTFGDAGERALRAAMAVSAIGVCAVNVIVTPQILVALSRSGLFFRPFGRLHPRTGAPVRALLVQLVVILGYLVWSHADLFVDYDPDAHVMNPDALASSVVFAEWIFHALTAWGLIRLRRLRPDLPRPYRSFLWPLAPALYLVTAGAVLIGNVATGPWILSGLGLTVCAAGAVVYLPWRRVVG